MWYLELILLVLLLVILKTDDLEEAKAVAGIGLAMLFFIIIGTYYMVVESKEANKKH